MCTCSRESQPGPELHLKQCGHQREGGDSAPLLCTGEIPPEVLCSVKGPQYRKGVDPGVDPEEGHKADQGDGAPLL